MKTIKKLFRTIVTTSLVLAFAGCGKKQEYTPTPSSNPPTPSTREVLTPPLMGETIAMIGPIASRLTDTNWTDAELKTWMKRSSHLQEFATNCDLRILLRPKDPRPAISEWPVAYVLFGDEEDISVDWFGGGNNGNIQNGFTEGMKIDGASDKDVIAYKMDGIGGAVYHIGKGQFGIEPCKAIGFALCDEISAGKSWTRISSLGDSPKLYNEDTCEGFWCAYSNRPVYIVFIETGSPLEKWITSAPYKTNLFSTLP